MQLVAVITLAVACLIATAAHAKTLYVNNTGSPASYEAVTISGTCSDATTHAANDHNSPWCTLSRAIRGSSTDCTGSTAAQAADGGDVLVVVGDHTCPGADDAQSISFNPVNSGDNATTGILHIKCYVALACLLGQSSTWSAVYGCVGSGPVLANGKDYVRWDGFEVDPDAVVGSDAGPILIRHSTGCEIINSRITHNGPGGKGIPHSTVPGGNGGPDGNLYEAKSITSCTAASPTVCTSEAHFFDTYTEDRNLLYLSGNSQVPNGLYYAISSDGCCITGFASTTQFSLVEAEEGLGFNGGYVGLGSVGAGGTFIQVNDHTNHAGIRVEYATAIRIHNNEIWNMYTGANVINGGCIETYRTQFLTITNNTLRNCGAGIHFKGQSDGLSGEGHSVRKNLIHTIGGALNALTGSGSQADCTPHGWTHPCIRPLAFEFGYSTNGAGVVFLQNAEGTVANPVRMAQNILYDAPDCIRMDSSDASQTAAHVEIVNNTFDQCSIAMLHIDFAEGLLPAGDVGYLWQNNIGSRVSGHVYAAGTLTDTTVNTVADFVFEHNRYPDFSGGTFGETSTAARATLVAWVAALTNHDDDVVASGTGSVSFVNLDARDYHLSGGSDALDDGIDVLDLDGDMSTIDVVPIGAYVIGNETIGACAVSCAAGTTNGTVKALRRLRGL